MLKALSAQDVSVRLEAVRILGDIGTLQSVPALKAARNEFVVQRTADAAINAIEARSKK